MIHSLLPLSTENHKIGLYTQARLLVVEPASQPAFVTTKLTTVLGTPDLSYRPGEQLWYVPMKLCACGSLGLFPASLPSLFVLPVP